MRKHFVFASFEFDATKTEFLSASIFRREQKAKLVKDFSKTASRIMNLSVEAMVTIIREVESENVGTGNIFLCDRR